MLTHRLTDFFPVGLCFSTILCWHAIAVQDIFAEGALSRVRNQVRSEPAASAHDDDDDDHDHHHHRPQRSRRRRPCGYSSCHPGPSFCLTTPFYPTYPPIVEYRVIERYETTSGPSFPTAPRMQPGTSSDSGLESVPAPLPDGAIPSEAASDPSAPATVFRQPWEDDWSLRLSAFYGHDLEDLSQANVSALWQCPGCLGIETSVTTFRESWAQQRDHLWLGDVNLVFETLHIGATRFRIGFGVNWLADTIGAEAGLNLTAGFDMPLGPRWILTGEADIGNLGAADFWHGQLTVGRQFLHTEWMLGLGHYNIGGEQLHSVFTGVRFRF